MLRLLLLIFLTLQSFLYSTEISQKYILHVKISLTDDKKFNMFNKINPEAIFCNGHFVFLNFQTNNDLLISNAVNDGFKITKESIDQLNIKLNQVKVKKEIKEPYTLQLLLKKAKTKKKELKKLGFKFEDKQVFYYKFSKDFKYLVISFMDNSLHIYKLKENSNA